MKTWSREVSNEIMSASVPSLVVALLRSKQGAGDAPYSDSKTRGPAPYAATFYRGYS